MHRIHPHANLRGQPAPMSRATNQTTLKQLGGFTSGMPGMNSTSTPDPMDKSIGPKCYKSKKD